MDAADRSGQQQPAACSRSVFAIAQADTRLKGGVEDGRVKAILSGAFVD
jgi:hypothetical protein